MTGIAMDGTGGGMNVEVPSGQPAFSIGTNLFEGAATRLERSHLAAIRSAGARYYELHVGYRFASGEAGRPWRVDGAFVDLRDEAFLARIAGWQRELGLQAGQMHGPASSDTLDYAADDESLRLLASDLLGVTARAAGRLGIPAVVIHPSVAKRPSGGSTSRSLSQLRRTVAERLEEFGAAGTTIALENLPPRFDGGDVAEVVTLCREFDSAQLGVCLDTGHARLSGQGPADAVRACGRWLRCLHVHDNGGREDEHLLPFDGGADWSGFTAALREVGYAGTLNLELNYARYAGAYGSPAELIAEAIRRVDTLYGR